MTDDLREFRQEIETRRRRVVRKHRLLKAGEVVAWAIGLLWTALFVRSLVRSPLNPLPPMSRAAWRAAEGYAAASSAAHLATLAYRPDEFSQWRPARIRAAPRPSRIAGSGTQPEGRTSQAEANAMAATGDPNEIASQGSQRSGIGGQSDSQMSNDAYNVISTLHAKLEELEAYRKYSRDGDERFWKELSERDNEAVQLLCDELEQLVRDGRLRTGQSGKSAH